MNIFPKIQTIDRQRTDRLIALERVIARLNDAPESDADGQKGTRFRPADSRTVLPAPRPAGTQNAQPNVVRNLVQRIKSYRVPQIVPRQSATARRWSDTFTVDC